MKNFLNKSILICAITFFAVGCGDFGDVNNDPNNPTSVATATLITSSLRSIADIQELEAGVLYAQMFSETQYTDDSRYVEINFDFNGWYSGPLANLEEVIRLNTDEATKGDAQTSGSTNNQLAVARILKSFFYHFMTDRWGPIPYTDALSGRDNFKPVYDSQEFIYNSLFTELAEAVAQIEDNGAPIAGDFLFGGDMSRWKQFANTLRIVMALRLSEVNPAKAEAEFNKAMSASGGVLTSVEDNMMYPYLPESSNDNPWYEDFITRTDYAISAPLVDLMKSTSDPRLVNYGDSAPGNPGEIVGMPYGLDPPAAGAIPNDDVSFPNSVYVKGQDSPIAIYTYAQVMFSMAEAAHRGWISGDAEAMYNEAIMASMAQWDVDGGDFVNNVGVKWDSNNALQLIGEQKWVALYLQGYEGWSEWRRLDYPALTPPTSTLNASGQIPRRQGYPTAERDLNSDNYNAALTLLGGADELDTRLWWDK